MSKHSQMIKEITWLFAHRENLITPSGVPSRVFLAKLIERFIQGSEEYEGKIFKRTPEQLQEDRLEELVDAEIYRLVALYGKELQ